MDDPLADRVVEATLAAYAALPKHGKPAIRSNGVPEWTIIASITLTSAAENGDPRVLPVSIGTGVKVLPAARLPPLGDTVHDCHAEILARRGFVRWLLHQATLVVRGDESDGLLVLKDGKFALCPGAQVWLYVSALPCGDASTLHTAAHQPADVAQVLEGITGTPRSLDGAVRGRNGYENYNAIRTKPGRPDSPPSISFSCSDKIALWTVLGLQGALLAPLFEPVYLDHIVVGGVHESAPESFAAPQDRLWRGLIRDEVDRALWGRLGPLNDIPEPYSLHKPKVHFTDIAFVFDKQTVEAGHAGAGEPVTSNSCQSHVPALGKPELLVNGCANTSSWKAPGMRLLKEKQRSRLCKLEIRRAYVRLIEEAEKTEQVNCTPPPDITYFCLKRDSAYQVAKSRLRGLPVNPLSSDWAARVPHHFKTTADPLDPPFKGWIVTGEQFESFTQDGELGLPL